MWEGFGEVRSYRVGKTCCRLISVWKEPVAREILLGKDFTKYLTALCELCWIMNCMLGMWSNNLHSIKFYAPHLSCLHCRWKLWQRHKVNLDLCFPSQVSAQDLMHSCSCAKTVSWERFPGFSLRFLDFGLLNLEIRLWPKSTSKYSAKDEARLRCSLWLRV